MKKFYYLFVVLFFTATLNAQGSETFESQTVLTGSYADGSFAGETAGVTINFVHSRKASSYGITGEGLMLRRPDEPSSVEFVIPNGVGEFTFKYRKAHTGKSDRALAVVVDGVETTVTPVFGNMSGEDDTVYTSTTKINKAGKVSVKITYPQGLSNRNRQVTIDDVSWTAPVLAVSDVDAQKNNFVRNTMIGNAINFGQRAEIKIFNMNGQVVKTASVEKNSSLDVSSLEKGVYIVAGEVNGKMITQKVIKK